MTRLSVNINKIALIRNSRGSNMPNLLKVALDCETFGAQGITVHPRPDQRHIRYDDISVLRKGVHTEFNIEGNPEADFMQLVLQNSPHQCTLVPDAPSQLTSDAGWDTVTAYTFLKDITKTLQNAGIRVSIFIDADEKHVEGAKKIGADRIEFYTGNFAHDFHKNPEKAVAAHKKAALVAEKVGIGVNAGHDLNLHNLQYYRQNVPNLLEVSIGHAIVCDALYYGLHNTIQMYLNKLK
jgi:pyridoxine 5-phosphate synthase